MTDAIIAIIDNRGRGGGREGRSSSIISSAQVAFEAAGPLSGAILTASPSAEERELFLERGSSGRERR